MATVFADDTIDFAKYMDATDSDHKVRPASDYCNEVIEYFHGSGKNLGATMPWEKTKDKIAFRPYEVTVWGGYNGHGKSLVIGQVMIHFMRHLLLKTCIASMEMKPHLTLARMCRQAANGRPDVGYIQTFHKGTDGLLWLYDQQGTIKGDKMAAVIRYAHERHGVVHFVIDSLLKCGYAEDDYTGQKMFVDQLCSIARDTGVHIHLVHHSRKGKDEYGIPGKHDMKGTGSIIDQVDNLIIVWRNKKKEQEMQQNDMSNCDKHDACLVIEKQRNGEWEGKFNFWFDPISNGLMETNPRGFR